MRITIQPAAELNTTTTAPAKSSSTSASPVDFGAALSAASTADATQVAHITPDRVNEKKNDRTKSTDADGSAPLAQSPTVHLNSLVMPIPTPTLAFIFGLPAPVNDATQQPSGQGKTATSDLSTLQSLSPATTSDVSALFGAATSSTPTFADQAMPTSQSVPASSATLSQLSLAMPAPLAEEAATTSAATPLPATAPALPAAKPAPIAASVSTVAASTSAAVTSPALPNMPQGAQAQTIPALPPTASNSDIFHAAPETLPIASSTPAPSISNIITPSQTNANSVDTATPASAAPQVSLASARTPSGLSTKTAPTDGARIHIEPTSFASVKSVTVEVNTVAQVQSDAKPLSPAPVSDPTPASPPSSIPVPAPVQAQDAAIDQNAAAAPLATSLPAQPTSLPPTVAGATQNVAPLVFGRSQLSVSTAKDGNARPGAVSGKDRSSATDAKGKRKFDSDSGFEDSDDQLATTSSSDAQSDVKPANASLQSTQSGGDQQASQHQAGSDALLQQAVQASVSIASPAPHTPPQTSASSQVSNAAPATAPSVIASNVNTAPSTAVNNAQLVQSIHQSDMRLGMHSPDFGAISINTSLAHQTLSAQISTDHSELSRALAMHLPSIEEKLGNAYGIHAKVEVHDSSTASYGDPSQQQSQSQQAKGDSQGPRQGGSFMDNSTPMQATIAVLSSSTASVVSSDARLDIRI